jgi:hypothetical protein
VVAEPDTLNEHVDPLVAKLFESDPTHIPRLTRRIDRISRVVLAPPATGSPSPSDSAQPSG